MSSDADDFWADWRRGQLERLRTTLLDDHNGHVATRYAAFYDGLISAEEFVTTPELRGEFPLDPFFREAPEPLLGFTYVGLASILVNEALNSGRLVEGRSDGRRRERGAVLDGAFDYLASVLDTVGPPPWVGRVHRDTFLLHFLDQFSVSISDLPPERLWPVTVLALCFLEQENKGREKFLESDSFACLRGLALAREQGPVEHELPRCFSDLNQTRQEILHRWARGEVSLVASSGAARS